MLKKIKKNNIGATKGFKQVSASIFFLLMFFAFAVQAQQKEDFIKACQTGNMKIIKRTVKDGFDINSIPPYNDINHIVKKTDETILNRSI